MLPWWYYHSKSCRDTYCKKVLYCPFPTLFLEANWTGFCFIFLPIVIFIALNFCSHNDKTQLLFLQNHHVDLNSKKITPRDRMRSFVSNVPLKTDCRLQNFTFAKYVGPFLQEIGILQFDCINFPLFVRNRLRFFYHHRSGSSKTQVVMIVSKLI